MSETDFVPPNRDDYIEALSRFDSAVCESCAVSQAQAGRKVSSQFGYGTRIYGRLCAAGVSLMRAAPLSRWVESEFEYWDLGTIAGHARSIFDGYLMFEYLMEECSSEEEERVKMNLMHLNDCSRRLRMLESTNTEKKVIDHYRGQREKLEKRLKNIGYFRSLPEKLQKRCLSGEKVMLSSRDQLLSKLGYGKKEFDTIYNLLSQHIHILPISFYNIEPNGRGTGIENEVDRGYLTASINLCEEMLKKATDRVVDIFPDTAAVRKGVDSKFSPGPKSNRPEDVRRIMKSELPKPELKRNAIAEAVRKPAKK